MKKLLLTTLCIFLLIGPSQVEAQDGGGDDIVAQSMNDIITVGALGGIGAILGLSTLSFVEEPSEHLRNVVVGGAIGIIIGVGVVAYKQANASANLYLDGKGAFYAPQPQKGMTTAMRSQWHGQSHSQVTSNSLVPVPAAPQAVNWQFSF